MIWPTRKKRPRMGVRAPAQFRCEGHLKWIRGCQCAIAGSITHTCLGNTEAAHVRTGTDGGTGVKPSDFWVIPLCFGAHKWQTDNGEAAFEQRHGIDMKSMACDYARRSTQRHRWQDHPAYDKMKAYIWALGL